MLLKAILRLEGKIDSNKILMNSLATTRMENCGATPSSGTKLFSLPIKDLIAILNIDKDLDTNISKTNKLVSLI
jgi:hypothetical protein